ncbi:MAG: hypothetical protein Q4B54_08305 [Coriobacteriales bacterium]|nr:hypothetical protein [Coriobacteriales bacterium]
MARTSEYRRLRQFLDTRYPKDADLKLNTFMQLETVLAIACAISDGPVCASKAYRILCNYALIRPQSFGRHGHLLQMARQALFPLSSANNWQTQLELYLQEEYSALRQYDVCDDVVVPRDGSFGAFDRKRIYLDHVLSHSAPTRKARVAQAGKTYTYDYKPESAPESQKVATRRERTVTIPELNLPSHEEESGSRERHARKDIVVTLEELCQAAAFVSDKSGRKHYADVTRTVVEQGLIKDVSGGEGKPCGQVTINRITGLVGQVGSGKSVFATVLMVALARRGLRVVSLLNSVSDVMDMVGILREVGVDASPLVSNNERVAHLNELYARGDGMMLSDTVARYLETPCIMDGLSAGEPEACSYADVPCHGLRAHNGARLSCPYWDVCPSTAMAREAVSARIVVSTPSGFATMRVGKDRIPFFEHAIDAADLVIFDEADRIQAQLDVAFAPERHFQDFIYLAADPTAQAMKRPGLKKTEDLDVERFNDRRAEAEPAAKSLLFSARRKAVASWRIVKSQAFTSLSLVNSLEQDLGLPANVARELEQRVNGSSENYHLHMAVTHACRGTDDDAHRRALDQFLETMGADIDDTLRERLSFTIKVICFDEYIRRLAADSDFLSYRDDSVADLYNFLRFSHTNQQKFLPSSPIGNVFGMRMTDDNDLILFRQFAFGRSLMNALPWLATDSDGNPLGPHALLLSGSYYLPGCLAYHINQPATYLLEAEGWKADKIAESRVCDLDLEQRVSGSSRQTRQANLNRALSNLMDTLVEELDAPGAGKILVVVNSYQEAKDAQARLEAELRKHGRSETACCMTKEATQEDQRFLPRSEVYRFASHPARVLVAPALAIERGYNIVDASGHAAITCVIFSVRPMGPPNDLSLRFKRMSGYIESHASEYASNAYDFAMELRADAWKLWKKLERDEHYMPSMWRSTGKDLLLNDTVATLLETIIQIFGRLLRLSDPSRPAPHLYFADASFRGPSEQANAFNTIEELQKYLERILTTGNQPAVARALYGPFYQAFMRGIS